MIRNKKSYEEALWAELTGLENGIKRILERRNEVANELQHFEIQRVRESGL
jgi:hypothetical protein